MYFRFGCALVLVVAISLLGASIEKKNLELRRMAAHQRFQMDVLRDANARKRLQVQQLGAPKRTIQMMIDGTIGLQRVMNGEW